MEPGLLIKASEYTEKLYKELTDFGFIAEIDSINPFGDTTWSKIYISEPEDDDEDGPYYSIEVGCAQENGQFAVSGLLFTTWYYDDDELVEEYDGTALLFQEDNPEVEPSEIARLIFEHVQGR